MTKKLILLIGAPGSGKTSDAKTVAEAHANITAYSTGELLDTEKNSESALGRIIQQYKDKGELVPAAVVIDTIFDAIKNSPTDIILLDGFPRDQESITSFCDILHNSHNIELDSVIEIRVSDEVAKERYLQNHNEGEEIFEKSLALYKETISYIEEHYQEKNLLQVIDGEQEQAKVIEAIDNLLKSHLPLETA